MVLKLWQRRQRRWTLSVDAVAPYTNSPFSPHANRCAEDEEKSCKDMVEVVLLLSLLLHPQLPATDGAGRMWSETGRRLSFPSRSSGYGAEQIPTAKVRAYTARQFSNLWAAPIDYTYRLAGTYIESVCCRNECMDSLLYGWITAFLEGEEYYIEVSVVRKGMTQQAAQGCNRRQQPMGSLDCAISQHIFKILSRCQYMRNVS